MQPIDPSDTNSLLTVHNEAMVKHDRYMADVVNSWEGNVSQDEIDDMFNDRPHSAIYAVARAVLPEGYVAVPVELLRYLLECMPIGYIEESERERAYALLPEEATR